MPMRCPHCGSVVEPLRDAMGELVCPACHNTGRVAGAVAPAAQPAAPAPGVPPYAPYAAPPPAPSSGKSIASLVVGIASIILWFLGLLLGPIALFLGISARKDVARQPGTGGAGMAIAGIVLGSIGCFLGLLGLAFFLTLLAAFGTIGELAQPPDLSFDVDGSGEGGILTLTDYSRPLAWEELELRGTASCSLPEGDVDVGDQVVCWTDGTVVVVHRVSDEAVLATSV